MKEIIKLGLILLLISAIAAAALGFVNSATKGPIEETQRLADIETRKSLLSEADAFEERDIESPETYPVLTEVYVGTKDGAPCGYTFKTTPKGYAGPVEVLIGIDQNGAITGVNIGTNTETPGLGSKAADEKFKGQYIGKETILNVIKSGTPKEDEISAISGATITSKAVTSGVNEALNYYKDNLSESN